MLGRRAGLGVPPSGSAGRCRQPSPPPCCCARPSASSLSARWCVRFAGARLQRLADGDGGRRYRRRQRGAVHLRQGAAQLSGPADGQAHRAPRHPASIRCRFVIPLVGLGLAAAFSLVLHRTRPGQSDGWRSYRTPIPARLMGIKRPAHHRAQLCAVDLPWRASAGLLIAPPVQRALRPWARLFGIKAFAVAILGGIGSAPGRDPGRPDLWDERGTHHGAVRLRLHADCHVHRHYRGACASCPRVCWAAPP